jgi:hypothetical protein
MSLHSVTTTLELTWQRAVRRHHPSVRWAEADPAIPAEPAELRRRLAAVFSADGRDLLARIVRLAAGGDEHAALAATLTVLDRQVRWETRLATARVSTVHVEHDVLAAAVWEAVVTEQRPERPFLHERLVQVAWRAARKPVKQAQRSLAVCGDVLERTVASGEDVAVAVATSVTITTLLDQLSAEGRLTGRGRGIVENLAAGGTGLRHDRPRRRRSAATERLRVVRRLRSDRVRAALAA